MAQLVNGHGRLGDIYTEAYRTNLLDGVGGCGGGGGGGGSGGGGSRWAVKHDLAIGIQLSISW